MKAVIVALSVLWMTTSVSAQSETPDITDIIQPAGTHELDEYLWIKRPVVVFADAPADPRYVEQMDLLTAELPALAERDVIVLIDTDPAARSPLRRALRPRGFVIALIGKDGGVKLRKPSPWSVRELSRAIDKMPMRAEELRLQGQQGATR